MSPRHIKLELMKILPGTRATHHHVWRDRGLSPANIVPPERLGSKIDSIGIPIPGVRSVLSPSGLEMGPGQIGELVARGANIMLGYYQDTKRTKKALDDHGYHTGDLGYRDEDGYFYVTGRQDDELKIGGHRIDPQEIEDVVVESGLAIEALVFGIPDEAQGQRLAGLIVPIRSAPDVLWTSSVLRHETPQIQNPKRDPRGRIHPQIKQRKTRSPK